MDGPTFKAISKRLKEANAVIEKLDPALREDAWTILRPYVSGHTAPSAAGGRQSADSNPPAPPSDADEETLIETFESDKDADNLYLVVAILYKRHGRGPYSLNVLRETAKGLDLSIPARPDLTFRNSKRNVLRKQSDGWKIQPGGEQWIKDTYGVKRGKSPLPQTT